MDHDKPLLGIVLMIAFCMVAPLGDAVGKLLAGHVPLTELVFVRFAVQVAVLAPLVLGSRQIWGMSRRVFWLILLRTGMHVLGIGMMFSALRYLPLADAVAISFILPFLTLLLGKMFLGEEVGWRRLAACAVGFVGTLMVVQPAFAEVGWPALLPLGVALNFAFFMLVTRKVSRDIDPIPLQAVSGLMAVVLIGPLLLVVPEGAVPGIGWIQPDGRIWGLLVGIGLLGTIAHLLMTMALRYAPGATLAPMQYSELPFATVIGFVIFGDLPNPMATAGICVIIAAGLYILNRERATHRARKAALVPETAAAAPAE